ncbi:MAG: DUF4231 domain-containing protein [Bacteroidia bacterium]|jgi:hypothetical protein|nr:DUF4231 domain-containing protein [Bacteroidia bacterium]
MTQDEYLAQRLLPQINWYSQRAAVNKRWHIYTRIAVIFLSALIPLIAGVDFLPVLKNALLGSLGALVVIIEGTSEFLKFREKWSQYRSTAELLKQEKMLFLTVSGGYIETGNAFRLLVARVEALINAENAEWVKYVKE